MKTKTRTIALALGTFYAFGFAANCGSLDDQGTKIDINEPNDLGVTALETTQIVDHGNNVFTLRGLSADGQQVASVRLTVGSIAELPQFLPGNDAGLEIVVSVAGSPDSRTLTHETQQVLYQPLGSSAAFVELPAVSSALKRAANIIVPSHGSTAAEVAEFVSFSYSESAAPAADLNAPPKAAAQQACLTLMQVYGNTPVYQWISQVLPNQSIGQRYQNVVGPGNGCKASDGTSSCASSACAFGPNGWSKPTVTTAPAGQYGFSGVVSENYNNGYTAGTGYACVGTFVTSPPTPVFPTVTGTYPSNCSCCSDGSGVCCGTACNVGTCAHVSGKVDAAAVAGQWDL